MEKTLIEKLKEASLLLKNSDFKLATAKKTQENNPLYTVVKGRLEVQDFALEIASICLIEFGCEEFAQHPEAESIFTSMFVSCFELGRAYEQIDSLEKLMKLEQKG